MDKLDLLIERHYKKKKKETFSVESLLEMVQGVYSDFEKIIREEAIPTIKKSREKMTYDITLIPMPQFSELGWGTLNTPKDGGTRPSSDPRQELAQYLANIGGTNLREKIEALNQFYSGEMAPENFTSQSDKISKYLSYLVVYKTLTAIFTGFNAASAGFLFEPFLAILLDAETGRQIPASGPGGGDTIADFTIHKDARPISLKAYKHGKLHVGGSFKQLITDLTGKYPVMEYIAVTKEMEAGGGDPMDVKGELHFRAFNFTFENLPDIIFKVSTPAFKAILQLPKIFWDRRIHQLAKEEGFVERWRLPATAELNIPALMDQFDNLFRDTFKANNFGDDVVEETLADFYEFVTDRETGEYLNSGGNHLKKPKHPSSRKNSAWQLFKDQWPEIAEDPDAPSFEDMLPVLQSIHTKWVDQRPGTKTGAARSSKIKELDYQAEGATYEKLKQLLQQDRETYRIALQHLRGVAFRDDFGLTEVSLEKNIASVGGEDLFPYGQYNVGSLVLGRENIQQVLERCINELNTSILDIFSSLRGLTDTINQYVSHGLEDDKLITDPQTGARAEAQNIDKKTGEMVDDN